MGEIPGVGAYFKYQQYEDELREFVAFLKNKGIKSFLEIGSKFGGVLWAVSRIMPKGSRIVSVDLPHSQWGRADSKPHLKDCIRRLKEAGYDAHVFIADSTAPETVEKVQALAPFDAIFIDANHTEPYVRKDFANYGKMTRILCFHDIGWNRPKPPDRLSIDVPKVWAELKQTYRDEASFDEIRRDPTGQDNGIGILQWR
jgi:predicted O-methyltransferase YrrM